MTGPSFLDGDRFTRLALVHRLALVCLPMRAVDTVLLADRTMVTASNAHPSHVKIPCRFLMRRDRGQLAPTAVPDRLNNRDGCLGHAETLLFVLSGARQQAL